MTWFLPQEGEVPDLVPRGPDRQVQEFGQGIGAGFQKLAIESNAFGRKTRAEQEAKANVLDLVIPKLGQGAVLDMLKNSPNVPGRLKVMPFDDLKASPYAQDEILRMAREAQTADPSAWNGLDLSQERIDRDTNEPMMAELQDAEEVLSMSPNPGLASFIGGAAASTLDPRALPFLLVGGVGGGSILRVMAREAAINMAVETATLPSQFEMAERLDIPDPDVRTQLLMAAAGGAVFGGAFEGGARALKYFRGRSARPPIPGLTSAQAELAVNAAEDAIVSGADPFTSVQSIIDATTRGVPEPRSPLVPNEIEQRRLDPLPGQKPEPIPNDELIAGLEQAIAEAKATDRKGSRPLAEYLRVSGKKGSENLKVHPEGTAAGELRARGITAKTMPGLFSKQGRKDFDNLVATEWEDMFPGIIDETRTQRGADYLDSQGFLDVLTRDMEGDAAWLRTRKDVLDLERQLDEVVSGRAAVGDFTSGAKANDGFFVDLNAAQMFPDWEDDIARGFEDYLNTKWEGTFFTPEEKAEMLDHLRSRGGDAEFLVERMVEREISEVRNPREDFDNGIPFGDDAAPPQEAVGRGAGDSGRPEVGTVAGREGAAGAGNAPGPLQDQPAGTERVQTGLSQRNRAEIEARQLQSRIGRLDQTRVEDDPGGLFGGAQREMFSEPTGKAAEAHLSQVEADIRDVIAKEGDRPLDVEEGDWAGFKSWQDVLDYIDEGDRFSARIDLCGKGPA